MSMDPRALATLLVENGVKWVNQTRQESLPLARALTDQELSTLRAHLSDLSGFAEIRVRFVPRLKNPPFYASLPDEDRAKLIDFTTMDAITFVDTILARDELGTHRKRWQSTLFHELVHVAQFAILGVDGFVREYVDGFVQNGFSDHRIPLEQMAYALKERFDRGEVFSLAKEVGRQLG